jgi:tetratricopeptide (TPR) repeat protein
MLDLLALLLLAPAVLENTYLEGGLPVVQAEVRARLAANPHDSLAHAMQARLHYKHGRWAAARAELAKAGEATLDGLYGKADYLMYTGEGRKALPLFERARALDPGHTHWVWGAGSAYLDAGRFDEAHVMAEKALPIAMAEGPVQHSRVLLILGGAQGLKASRGSLFDKLRYGPQVRSTLERALAVAPRNPNALYAVGRYYFEAPAAIGGNQAKAITYFEQTVAIDPYVFPPQAWLIRALRKTGKAERAADLLKQYRRRFAQLPQALREVADL